MHQVLAINERILH